jgi:hypothetical protein
MLRMKLRFSLRTLILAVAAVAIITGACVTVVRARQQASQAAREEQMRQIQAARMGEPR